MALAPIDMAFTPPKADENKGFVLPWPNNLFAVSSLFGVGYLATMNVSWLNPSACESKYVHRVGKSIADTIDRALKQDPDLFAGKPKTSKVYKYGHYPASLIMRGITVMFLSFTIAPLGVLFNGSICTLYILKIGAKAVIMKTHLIAEENLEKWRESQAKDWESVKFFAIGLGTDTLMSMPPLVIFMLTLGINPQEGALAIFLPFIAAFCPEEGIQMIADDKKRVGLLKAILLKNIGIEGPWGELLKASEIDDETEEGKGTFFALYITTAEELVDKLSKFKEDKGIDERIPLWKSQYDWSTTKEHEIQESYEAAVRQFGEDKLSDAEVQEILVLFNRFLKLKSMIKTLLDCRYSNSYDFSSSQKESKTFKVGVPDCFREFKTYENYWNNRTYTRQNDWQELLAKWCEDVVKKGNPVPSFASQRLKDTYIEFRAMACDGKDPFELLGLPKLEDQTEDNVNRQYKRYIMIFHPDRVPEVDSNEVMKQEVETLFKILTAAKNKALEIISTR